MQITNELNRFWNGFDWFFLNLSNRLTFFSISISFEISEFEVWSRSYSFSLDNSYVI